MGGLIRGSRTHTKRPRGSEKFRTTAKRVKGQLLSFREGLTHISVGGLGKNTKWKGTNKTGGEKNEKGEPSDSVSLPL